MSHLLPHLHSDWAVDEAILAEEKRLVVIRFGHDSDEACKQIDEILASVAEGIKRFAAVYLVDMTETRLSNANYELVNPSNVMFFFKGTNIMIDLGTGTKNKIDSAIRDKLEFLCIAWRVYNWAMRGRRVAIF